jgi:hypothetical protein
MKPYDWTYKGKPFTSADIGKAVGFVYCITCTTNGMRYIGKKQFEKSVKKHVVKKSERGKKSDTLIKDMTEEEKKARTKVVRSKAESDWKEYFGSSEELLADIEKFGKEAFLREILELAHGKGTLGYLELKHQMAADALRRGDYYNSIINVRLHRRAVFTRAEIDQAYRDTWNSNPDYARTHPAPVLGESDDDVWARQLLTPAERLAMLERSSTTTGTCPPSPGLRP